jgi:pimeloyl-ACP methyl ester carboxylesterase
MPIFRRANAWLYYEETGAGEPILTLHGLCENAGYWSGSGVSARLAERYRVISLDMRAHGRTRVEGEPRGYDVETIGEDLDALADGLAIDRFHLLAHATGGMVAVRYAMRRGERLRSLILTDTGSATAVTPGDPEARSRALDRMARGFEHRSWDEILPRMRQNPGAFLFQLDRQPERERLWRVVQEVFRLGDPDALGAFIRAFYSDPDPHVEGLRRIPCPTLVLLGEHDRLFLEPSELLAKEIPRALHVILDGVGHMTAIEDPERTSAEIHRFLASL